MKTTIAVAATLIALNLQASVKPTPQPKWYAARVQGELYGTFRKQATAAAFCATVPASAGGCVVVPIHPVSAWTTKGAR